ncbi:MAG: DUF898 domain-containing protein [Nitrospira sp.]|nr:DUF898 domain-containing protein [bacterium]MBL7048248.1 DUF898 domain-containing protein [Nitrospira sp.]
MSREEPGFQDDKCSICGSEIDAHGSEERLCRKCEREVTGEANPDQDESVAGPYIADTRTYDIRFTGSAGEFFRIWIVNTFLTIITLGIYAAWAKVRNRQYFYRNTLLDGHVFDYTANPVAILKGNLIVGGGAVIYAMTEVFNPLYSAMVVLVFSLFIPFLVYKSLRFMSRNSVYRNVSFGFRGSLSDSYVTYLLYPFLIPFTLGLIMPYWAYAKKKYFFGNMQFGTTENKFRGKPGSFYAKYAQVSVFTVSVLILIGVVTFAGKSAISELFTGYTGVQNGMVLLFMFMFYMALFMFVTLIQQYIYAWMTNYCFIQSSLGSLSFQSTLKGKSLMWIRVTNVAAILFSLGLLIPWAQIRRTRYILENLKVVTDGNLDEFQAASRPEEGALGEASTDFFDLEIGL